MEVHIIRGILSLSLLAGIVICATSDEEVLLQKKNTILEDPPRLASHGDHSSPSPPPEPSSPSQTPAAFSSGFLKTLSVIGISELGDKTFFIAALMAMKYPRRVVFLGAAGALTLMHTGSSLFGILFAFIPPLYVTLLSAGFFAVFGLKLLWEGFHINPEDTVSELQEVTEEIQKKEEAAGLSGSLETGGASNKGPPSGLAPLFQTFTMTFFAEWGDRSQISTIVLAAKENLTAVILGGLLGHYLCSGLAVVGGRALSARISVKSITILGGAVFCFFALSTLIFHGD